jgi:hypothetical protein
MVKLVIATLVLLTAVAAYAEPLPVPMPERGGSCPHGFTHSGGFCAPSPLAPQHLHMNRHLPSQNFSLLRIENGLR